MTFHQRIKHSDQAKEFLHKEPTKDDDAMQTTNYILEAAFASFNVGREQVAVNVMERLPLSLFAGVVTVIFFGLNILIIA